MNSISQAGCTTAPLESLHYVDSLKKIPLLQWGVKHAVSVFHLAFWSKVMALASEVHPTPLHPHDLLSLFWRCFDILDQTVQNGNIEHTIAGAWDLCLYNVWPWYFEIQMGS